MIKRHQGAKVTLPKSNSVCLPKFEVNRGVIFTYNIISDSFLICILCCVGVSSPVGQERFRLSERIAYSAKRTNEASITVLQALLSLFQSHLSPLLSFSSWAFFSSVSFSFFYFYSLVSSVHRRLNKRPYKKMNLGGKNWEQFSNYYTRYTYFKWSTQICCSCLCSLNHRFSRIHNLCFYHK